MGRFNTGTGDFSSSVKLISGSWTVGLWAKAASFTANGRIFNGDLATVNNAFLRWSGTGGALETRQDGITTNARKVTSTTIAANTWTFLASVFDGTNIKIYIGDLATSVAEASYTTDTAISGGMLTWDHAHIGNNHAATTPMVGSMARPFLTAEVCTLERLIAIQLGDYGALYDNVLASGDYNLRFFADFTSILPSKNPNLVTSATTPNGLTSSGVAVGFNEEPPVPFHLGQ